MMRKSDMIFDTRWRAFPESRTWNFSWPLAKIGDYMDQNGPFPSDPSEHRETIFYRYVDALEDYQKHRLTTIPS